jgi:Outer membrane protein beta-barrel domain
VVRRCVSCSGPVLVTRRLRLADWLARVLLGIALVAALAWGAPANAQAVNLLVGLTRSTLSSPPAAAAPDAGALAVSRGGGAYLGFSLGTKPTRLASLAVEGAYMVRAIKLTSPTGLSVERLKYLESPILARLSAGRLGGARLHVLGGPTFAVRLTANDEATGASVGSLVRRFDAGVLLGGGVDVHGLAFQARYEWGLTNAARGGGLLGNDRMKNRTLVLLVALPAR